MKKKILVLVYNLERAIEHEWFVEYMDPDKYEIQFVLIRKEKSYLHQFLEARGIRVFYFDYKGKSDLPLLILKLTKLMRSERFNIVHAHLFEASLAGLTAAWLSGIKHRIVTRHHSDYHHIYNPSAVKYDKFINSIATKIIAVSKNVENILLKMEHADPSKVITIPHGINVKNFHPEAVSSERKEQIRKKYNIETSKKVVGVVSRFISWKGLSYIIPAFKIIKQQFPGSILILANAQGPDEQTVMKMLQELNKDDFRLITFEEDMPALYGTFSCFLHVPVSATSEAFGQTYIEALAAGIPSVFTLSGVAHDFAENEVNCLLVPYQDSKAIADAATRLLDDKNSALRSRLIQNGLELVGLEYKVEVKYQRVSQLYDSLN